MMANYITNRNYLLVALLALISTIAVAAETNTQVGSVVFARGIVTAQITGEEVRILGTKSAIFENDVITTGEKSFTVIKLNDDSRISLRPGTVFTVEDFSQEENNESAVMRLFKGGLRTISGLITKKNPDAFKLNTAVATIGIRGTEFDARLCDIDCAIENEKFKKTDTTKANVVARVAFLKGQLSATNSENTQRQLALRGAIYEGDILTTGVESFAVIAFQDEGRVTMKAETEFKIEQHRYQEEQAEESSAVYRLIKGGIRTLTGLIGKRNRDAYKINTPTATIGIRGTGMDLVWLGACGSVSPCGLVGYVWEGIISVENESGIIELQQNQVILVRFVNQAGEFLDTPPVFIVPRPDEVDIDFESLFSALTEDSLESGLYVACYEGTCILFRGDESLELDAGDAGFVSLDGRVLARLEAIPPFQSNDPYLQTINEDLETLFELLDDSVIEQNEFECIVQ